MYQGKNFYAVDYSQAEKSLIEAANPHESVETTQIYLDADLDLKQKLLDQTTPPSGKPGRYRPDDKLLAFLRSL